MYKCECPAKKVVIFKHIVYTMWDIIFYNLSFNFIAIFLWIYWWCLGVGRYFGILQLLFSSIGVCFVSILHMFCSCSSKNCTRYSHCIQVVLKCNYGRFYLTVMYKIGYNISEMTKRKLNYGKLMKELDSEQKQINFLQVFEILSTHFYPILTIGHT